MGYWPKELFPYLLEGANYVHFGGEIYYRRVGSHTSTQMGSGHFAEEGFKKASFFKNVQFIDDSYVYRTPAHVDVGEEVKKCYEVKVGRKTDGLWGQFFFFRGAGGSDQCTWLDIHKIDNHSIDCIDIYQQPAFQHPSLVNHTLQLKPNYPIRPLNYYASKVSLPWSSSQSCPKGSIPIERIQGNDLFTNNNLVNHTFHKHPHHFLGQREMQQGNDEEVHECYSSSPDKTYGLKATLNVWNPKVEKQHEFSVSQVWLIGGEQMNTLEAGWAVFPTMYGTTETRFFIYWTPDQYKTGCYNLRCPGFVQTNPHTTLDSYLLPISVYGGPQYAIDVEIFKDKITGNWWLRLQGVDMGYWPKELFPYLLEGANYAHFGGEIYYRRVGSHTSTQMGGGHFAEEGFKKASFFKNVQFLDDSYVYQTLVHVDVGEEVKKCYDVKVGRKTDGLWG
ncbi:hypothetical protein Taro_026228 [Colocasia esculenta]|uniref:Neprosin PEP catalytic domain-containing protein n=1 Tax=Colocasia esculenta TaxID=4460 RepID=A0A843VJ02_COLES|nr:hypothetical protein [Colocasia esculenta]